MPTVASTAHRNHIDTLYNVLASHTTYVVYFNFIREWRDLQFNLDSEAEKLGLNLD